MTPVNVNSPKHNCPSISLNKNISNKKYVFQRCHGWKEVECLLSIKAKQHKTLLGRGPHSCCRILLLCWNLHSQIFNKGKQYEVTTCGIGRPLCINTWAHCCILIYSLWYIGDTDPVNHHEYQKDNKRDKGRRQKTHLFNGHAICKKNLRGPFEGVPKQSGFYQQLSYSWC